MKKIQVRFFVKGLASEPPFVRVSGYFHEGGTPYRSALSTPLNFLVDSFNVPAIDQELVVIIKEKSN